MSDERVIEVDNGTVELVGTPGHVNVIASDGENEAELRLRPGERDQLAWGVRENQPVNIELSDGCLGWEPGRGLYVEVWAEDSFYLVFSPAGYEALNAAFMEVQPI